jgi:ribosome-associated heat shock protein Hsp15
MRDEGTGGTGAAGVRLDKWLWAARLFKTRATAAEEAARGRVQVNGQAAKPSRELRPGDRLSIRREGFVQELDVLALSHVRGPATVARLLYEQTPQSLEASRRVAESRRLGVEPALAQDEGRPTKRDRRQLVSWQRWSASLDER